MLYVYGPQQQVRILEEIVTWKTLEREHTTVIRAIVPGLAPAYIKLLADWEAVFRATAKAAALLLDNAWSSGGGDYAYLAAETGKLLELSLDQSREYIRQLYALMEQSPQIKAGTPAKTALLHAIWVSEYFMSSAAVPRSPGLYAAGTGGGRTDAEPPASPPLPAAEAGNGTAEVPDEREARNVQPGGWEEGAGEPGFYSDRFVPPFDLSASSEEAESAKQDAGAQQAAFLSSADGKDDSFEGVDADSGRLASTGSPVPIGGHRLPPLPYAYDALEPYIDEETMRIHHDKHHQSYVDGLNTAENKLAEARRTGDFALVKHWERELTFNGAGHYLHTIFWNEMSPQGGGRPTGALLNEIENSFGSYDAFKKQFSEAANKVEGGGWAILVWSPRSGRLEILTAEKHQNLSQWDVVPLLALDVWEHAYYLKHQNKRDDYIKDWWNVVNWPYVSERYEAAKQLVWEPY